MVPDSNHTISSVFKTVDQKNLTRMNEQKIKLYISQCSQSIPDIVNQPEQSIYSHFKFYFNDDQLILQQKDQSGDIISLMHHKDFQTEINNFFEQWINEKILNAEKQAKQKQIDDKQSVEYRNFIAFVQYWIRKSFNLMVTYTLYDQIVKQCVADFLENSVNQISFNLTNQKPFKLKNPPKNDKKCLKNSEKCSSLTSATALKRLNIYFNHFSKMQNLSSGSSIFSKNGSKTFDQIGQSYSTVNLQQWICFIKAFNFDKIFKQNHNNRAKQSCNSPKTSNNKQYLPVKWNTSLHYFKNLFEKFCDNSKQLNFQSFQSIIKKLFIQLFSKPIKSQPIPIQNNIHSQQNKQIKQNAENGEASNTLPSILAQQIGINHLKLSNQQQFNNKLRGLGVFVPIQPTHIPLNHYPNNKQEFSKKSNSYSHIKPKYLKIQPLPNLSPNKIKQGLLNNKLDNKNDIILPSLNQEKNAKLRKYYTLSQLMEKNLKINESLEQESKKNEDLRRKENKKLEKSQNKIKQTVNNNQIAKNKSSGKGQIQNKCVPLNSRTQSQQQDQFLMQYYNKNSGLEQRGSHLPRNANSAHYSTLNNDKIGNLNYNLGNNLNLLKRINQRIQKINKKML